jgi:hypothetical protein
VLTRVFSPSLRVRVVYPIFESANSNIHIGSSGGTKLAKKEPKPAAKPAAAKPAAKSTDKKPAAKKATATKKTTTAKATKAKAPVKTNAAKTKTVKKPAAPKAKKAAAPKAVSSRSSDRFDASNHDIRPPLSSTSLLS